MEQNSAGIDSSFSALVKNHIKVLAESIKISSSLPVGSARTNFTTCFPEFNNEIKPCSDQLEDMMSAILKKEGFKADIKNYDSEDKVDLVVDGVNKILDRVKRSIDTLNGVTPIPEKITEPSPSTEGKGSWNVTTVKKKKPNFFDMRPTNMPKVHIKPQLHFEVKVDNSKDPFKPSLIEKPNALKPLSLQLERGVDGIDRYNHPYLYELNFFSPPTSHLHKVHPVFPWNVDDKPETFIDTMGGLKDMIKHLKEQSEIAVDLEHHEYRSFQGFTCLMQISSRKEDFIIDAIKLRKELVELNQIFTDPGIVKVFHGAELDVEWLQKDLSLYVVNMFDTFFAARHLNLTRCGLAFLLERYCNLKSDKQYQLYDWRIRPLGKEAQAYARSDTHYLLYVYDRIRNDLIDKAGGKSTLVQDVFFRATELCKKRYEKPPGDETGYLKMYKDSRRQFNNQQLYALQHLYMWRDDIARKEDESYRFVLPNHQMLRLAELLPRDRNGILGCCVPLPALVRKNLADLQTIIFTARQQPLQTSESQHFTNSLAIRTTTLLSKLRSPHDFSHYGDIRDDLATLLDGSDVIDVKTEKEARLAVFNNDFTALNQRPAVKFVSPYERFRKTTEFVLSQEKKNRSLTKENEESEEEEEVVKFIPKSERHLDTKQKKEEVAEETITQEKEEKAKPLSSPKETVKIPDNVPWKRKAESLSEQVPNKKMAKSYEVAKSVAQVDKPEPKSVDDFPKLESDSNETIVEEKKTEKKPVFGKAKKRKKTERTNNEFVAHDYSAGNYNKFSSGNRKNVKQLLSSKISFGANKNKKNRQKFQHSGAGIAKAKK